jgi:uncharacterized protein YuzE
MIYSRSPADVLDIDLVPEGRSARTVQFANANLDIDAQGRLIAIEIIGASRWYLMEDLIRQPRPKPELLSLAQAATEERTTVVALRSAIRRGLLPGVKQGGRWVVARHELWNYLENRAS